MSEVERSMFQRCIKRLTPHWRYRENEQGAVLLIIAIGAIAFLALAGLAIDASSLYRTQIALQGATDAGAIYGGRCLLIGDTPAQCEPRIRSLMVANLELQGFPASVIQEVNDSNIIKITITTNPQVVTIEGNIYHETSILKLLPGFQDGSDLPLKASAENINFHISLVLDRSESMALSDVSPVSGCFVYDTQSQPILDSLGQPIPCVKRIDAAKYAAKKFIDQLWPTDEIAIITYGINSTAGQSNWQQFSALHRALIPVSQFRTLNPNPIDTIVPANADATHIAAGLTRGINQLLNASNRTNVDESIVLLTDGVPNGYNANVFRNPVVNTDCPGLPINHRRYIDTIHTADFARSNGITVYTVGYGNNDLDTSSPFQFFDVGTAGAPAWGGDIKKFLMERVANDQPQLMAPMPLPTPTPSPSTYYYDFPCNAQTGAQQSAQAVGTYFIAGDGVQLVNSFTTIASKIRTSLFE